MHILPDYYRFFVHDSSPGNSVETSPSKPSCAIEVKASFEKTEDVLLITNSVSNSFATMPLVAKVIEPFIMPTENPNAAAAKSDFVGAAAFAKSFVLT